MSRYLLVWLWLPASRPALTLLFSFIATSFHLEIDEVPMPSMPLASLCSATDIRTKVLRSKVTSKQCVSDRGAKLLPILQRVVVVEAGINPCPEDFVDQIAGILERVRVDAVLERETVRYQVNFGSAKVARQQYGDGPAGA